MKARPAKNKAKKRTLHQPPAELVRAKRIHATKWWQADMDAERAKHAKERQADYKQPYRMNEDSLRDCYSINGREKKKLIRLWVSRGLNIPEMMKLYGFIK